MTSDGFRAATIVSGTIPDVRYARRSSLRQAAMPRTKTAPPRTGQACCRRGAPTGFQVRDQAPCLVTDENVPVEEPNVRMASRLLGKIAEGEWRHSVTGRDHAGQGVGVESLFGHDAPRREGLSPQRGSRPRHGFIVPSRYDDLDRGGGRPVEARAVDAVEIERAGMAPTPALINTEGDGARRPGEIDVGLRVPADQLRQQRAARLFLPPAPAGRHDGRPPERPAALDRKRERAKAVRRTDRDPDRARRHAAHPATGPADRPRRDPIDERAVRPPEAEHRSRGLVPEAAAVTDLDPASGEPFEREVHEIEPGLFARRHEAVGASFHAVGGIQRETVERRPHAGDRGGQSRWSRTDAVSVTPQTHVIKARTEMRMKSVHRSG